MKKFSVGLTCLLLLVLAVPALAVSQSRKPATAPPEIERGVFVDYGYSSPPWYPPEEETDSYRWAPKYYWVDSSIEVKVNPTASGFATEELEAVVAEVEKGFEAWDEESGPYSAMVERDDEVGPSLDEPDYSNTVSWGEIDGPGGIIAVTYYWYYTNTKELVDADIVFDAAEPWSISPTVPLGKFDIWNIAAHEAGHTLVLQDLRSPKDGALTMHAYTWLGDITKRTLGSGDIFGVQAIYGE